MGRTLTPWNAWAEKKCLLNNFDQIEFYPVSEDEFMQVSALLLTIQGTHCLPQLERSYKAGSLKPESSKGTFNMSEYLKFMVSHEKEVEEFKKKQKEASEFLVEK